MKTIEAEIREIMDRNDETVYDNSDIRHRGVLDNDYADLIKELSVLIERREKLATEIL